MELAGKIETIGSNNIIALSPDNNIPPQNIPFTTIDLSLEKNAMMHVKKLQRNITPQIVDIPRGLCPNTKLPNAEIAKTMMNRTTRAMFSMGLKS